MLYEIKKIIFNKSKINWTSRGRIGEIWTDTFMKNNSINQISKHKKFINLFPITGYKSHSECSFVQLK